MASIDLPDGTTPGSLSSVKSKILLATAIVMLAFAAVVSVQVMALNSLKVGGPVFQQINYDKDLIADILPPPEYIIEAFLEATLAMQDPNSVPAHQKRLKQLHRDYDDRHSYWEQQPIDKDIKGLLLDSSDAEVRPFWQITENSFLPALERGDAKGAEEAYKALSARYNAHRAIIDKVVSLANADNDKTVGMAARQDITYSVIVWSVVAFTMLLLSAGAYWMMRQIVGPLRTMTSAMGALASGALDVAIPSLDRNDEIGDLASAMAIFRGELTSAERARQNQSGAVHSIGDGLASLSNGDLTFRMSADFGEVFVKLQQDFNGALERLQDTLSTVLTSTSGIATGAGEISHAADDLSRRTEQQAAALEETAAALEQITATVKKTAQNAKDASVIVTKARVAAENGGQIVSTAIRAMGEIENSSKEITDIIGVIEEIAFQTNLLALNAGVEAARAGDSGKGFAVVASEVRTLAQRSSDAARQIKKLITTSAEQVASGVKLVGDSGGALNGIIGQVVEVNALVTEMAQAAQQQSIAIEEVNVAISQMDQVTQQNAAMVEQTTAASHRLASETTDLSDRISFFNVGASGSVSKTSEAKPRVGGKAKLRAVM